MQNNPLGTLLPSNCAVFVRSHSGGSVRLTQVRDRSRSVKLGEPERADRDRRLARPPGMAGIGVAGVLGKPARDRDLPS